MWKWKAYTVLSSYIRKISRREKNIILEGNVFYGSALVYMYAKCGSLGESKEVFDTLSVQNVVTWTTLIKAYTNQMHGMDALHYFHKVQDEGITSPAYIEK